jgi:hypothetical protein
MCPFHAKELARKRGMEGPLQNPLHEGFVEAARFLGGQTVAHASVATHLSD